MPISPATRRSFVHRRHADRPTTYDAFARVRTFTDSESWTVTYDYDAADRVTKATYPDGTTEISTYNRLDLASFQDRKGGSGPTPTTPTGASPPRPIPSASRPCSATTGAARSPA